MFVQPVYDLILTLKFSSVIMV